MVIHSETPSSRPTNDALSSRLNVGWARVTISGLLSARLGRRGTHGGARWSCARRCAIAELLAQQLLVELADARPGQRRHEYDLIRHRVARYHALTRVFLQGRPDLAVGDRRALLENHDGERTFGPLRIGNANDGSFAHAWLLKNEVLDVERGHPFATGLDHVFETVGDFQITIRADDPDIAGVQPPTEPQLFRVRRIAQVTLRQPRRARHDLARRCAVARNIPHLRIDDAQIDQRDRTPRLDPHLDLTIDIPYFIFGSQMSQREHGTSLRHAVAGRDVDAVLHGFLRQGPRQRGPANNHLPALEHSLLRVWMGENHLQNGWDAVRECDLLARDQVEHEIGRIFPRIDLLESERRRHVGEAPGMNVEHGRYRHVHVAIVETAVAGAGDRVAQRKRMQRQLSMAEVNTLGKTGRAGGVEGGRPRVLVEVGED